MLVELLERAQHELAVCNACRYCEGYCAVFPAIERRAGFAAGDLAYIANLCHDCRACHQACMYTEPHEFALNIPLLLAEARVASYERYARPSRLGGLFMRGPMTRLAVTIAILGVITGAVAAAGTLTPLSRVDTAPGSFYRVVSHLALIVPALLLTVYGCVVVGMGALALWRDAGGSARDLLRIRPLGRALREVATLRWMGGGGGGCFYPDAERASSARRTLHSLVAYGFLLALLATVSAFVEETAFGVLPPYPLASVPVVLGTAGGIALIAGCLGLLWLKRRQRSGLAPDSATRLDQALLAALLLAAATGVALLVVRDTAAMRSFLLAHLAAIAALYLFAPYDKFVHAAYRLVAVLRSVHERTAVTGSEP